ncbi:MAG: recombinase family protein [Anaerocolumna sp.]
MSFDKKRVVCFYRVSTKKQVTEDDIPMQRNACLEFITYHKEWEFVNEYSEKGVSGFKVKADKREVLEQLRADALKDLFDVILVFMFDRLGRMEEETPYVLKWFINHGIEMWSVKEGQRVLDSHIDSLLNYITFWQAEGESKKIQQRTLEAKKQMAEAGKYLGCAPAYGYKHRSTGEHNAKGREIKQLVIDESEAAIVKKIFDLSTRKGYGSRRIAKALNEAGVLTKKGKQWSGSTVMGILKNTIYKGYFTYGRNTNTYKDKRYTNQSECKVSSVKCENLAVISEAQWMEAQKLIQTRAGKVESNVPRQTKSPLLFTGYSYCKYCGARLTLHYSYINIEDKQELNKQEINRQEINRQEISKQEMNKQKPNKQKQNKLRKPFYVCYGKQTVKRTASVSVIRQKKLKVL